MSYSLEIVSQSPEFKGKTLKKYKVDEDYFVGAMPQEAFEIVFKNHTAQKVQVKISIDGTDVLTGEMANTETTKDMWMVNAFGTLRLQAWPETTEGGAQFVFTHEEKSVAVHTHGDLSSRGIIAAAVFTESYGYYLNTPFYENYKISGGNNGFGLTKYGTGILRGNSNTTGGYFGSPTWIGGTLSTDTVTVCGDVTATSTYCDYTGSNEGLTSNAADAVEGGEFKSLASVGAGQQVSQAITTVAGLYKPQFNSIVKVKYMWWSDLVPKLEAGFVKQAGGSGFPGDRKKLINLGKTPRIGDAPTADPQPCLSRF